MLLVVVFAVVFLECRHHTTTKRATQRGCGLVGVWLYRASTTNLGDGHFPPSFYLRSRIPLMTLQSVPMEAGFERSHHDDDVRSKKGKPSKVSSKQTTPHSRRLGKLSLIIIDISNKRIRRKDNKKTIMMISRRQLSLPLLFLSVVGCCHGLVVRLNQQQPSPHPPPHMERSSKTTTTTTSRRTALEWLVQSSSASSLLLLTTTPSSSLPAWADLADNSETVRQQQRLPDSFDIDHYLKTGFVNNPMGVSGQAGKSRPETGVVLREGSEASQDARGSVLAEILLTTPNGQTVPYLATFSSPWPLGMLWRVCVCVCVCDWCVCDWCSSSSKSNTKETWKLTILPKCYIYVYSHWHCL